MSRAFVRSFAALLCVPCAIGQTERKPTTHFANAHPRWLAYTSPDATVTGGALQSHLEGLSVAVDARNIAHVVAIERDPARPEHRLLYFTTRFDTRRSNGFSAPVELDRALVGENEIPIGTLTGRGLRDLTSVSACGFLNGILAPELAGDAVLAASRGRSVQPRIDGVVFANHTTPDLLAGLVDSLLTAALVQDKQDKGLDSIIDLIKGILGQNEKLGKAFEIFETIQDLIKKGKFSKADAIAKLTGLLDLLDAVAGGDISKVHVELLKWLCLLEGNGVMKLPMKDKFVIAAAPLLEKWWDSKSDKENEALKEKWQKTREKLGELNK